MKRLLAVGIYRVYAAGVQVERRGHRPVLRPHDDRAAAYGLRVGNPNRITSQPNAAGPQSAAPLRPTPVRRRNSAPQGAPRI